MLFSSKLNIEDHKNLHELKKEEEALNSKLNTLEEMEEKIKDAKK